MKRIIYAVLVYAGVLLLSMNSANANATTLLDRLKPYVGKPVELARGGKGQLKATLISVDEDHFCATVHVPDFEHERCYSKASIYYVSNRGANEAPWIHLAEP